MSERKKPALASSLTIPVEHGYITVSRGALRAKATLRFSRLELHADIVQLGDLIDALIARRNAMAESDTTGDVLSDRVL